MSIFSKIMGEIFGYKDDCPVDVAAILDKACTGKKEKLDWRVSVIDLMKALEIDASLAARKALARELGYKVTKDTGAMNVWLHDELLKRFAANGGKIPAQIP